MKENFNNDKKMACVLTHGCPESRIDSARVQVFLQKNGYCVTKKINEANLILFRTCGLTMGAEAASLETIKNIKFKKKRDANFIPWGCLPKINPAVMEEYADIAFGEKDIGILNEIIKAEAPIEDVHANFLLPKYKHTKAYSRIIDFPLLLLPVLVGIKLHPHTRCSKYGVPYYIKISTGCLCKCAFCAVRLSRGVLCSKSVESVLSEFKEGLAKGHKDFRLLGTDLGAYGRDKGQTLSDLLNRMTKEEGDYCISLNNVNAGWLIKMYEELQPSFSSGKVRYLNCAFESGSNRILGLMGRTYRIEEYKRCMKDLSQKHSYIMKCTQVVVGFPNETHEDFLHTEQVLKDVLFDMVEPYKYSQRCGTPAAEMSGQVVEHIKNFRLLRIAALSIVNIFRQKIKRLCF